MRVPAHAAISTTVALVRSDVGPGAAGFANAVLRRVSEHDLDGVGRAGRAGACRRPGRVPERRARPPAVGGRGARRGRRRGRDRGAAGRRQRGARRDPGGPSRALDPRGAAGRAHALVAVRRAPGLRRPGCRRGRGGGPGGRPGRGLAAGRARPGLRRRSTGRDLRWLDLCAGPGGKAALLAALAAEPRGRAAGQRAAAAPGATWSGARSAVPTACWAWSPATAPARRGPPARSTGCSWTRRAPAWAPCAGVPRRAGAGSPPTSTPSYPSSRRSCRRPSTRCGRAASSSTRPARRSWPRRPGSCPPCSRPGRDAVLRGCGGAAARRTGLRRSAARHLPALAAPPRHGRDVRARCCGAVDCVDPGESGSVVAEVPQVACGAPRNRFQCATSSRSSHVVSRRPQSPTSRIRAPGIDGEDGGVGRAQHLALRGHHPLEDGDQGERGGERQRGLGLVEAVEAAALEPGLQQGEERLAVAELVEARVGRCARWGAARCRSTSRAWSRPGGRSPTWTPPSPRCTRSACPSGDSVGRVACMECVDPPSGLSPNAIATASTIVDLPEPFSPTRNVTPLARSIPSRATWATAGMVSGHSPEPARRPATTSTRRTGGWSKSTRSGTELEAVHRASRRRGRAREAGGDVQRLRARPHLLGLVTGAVAAGTPRPRAPLDPRRSSRAAAKIRRARPCPRYGASTMKQLIAHVSGSGSSENVSAIFGIVVARACLHPADRCPVDVREVAVVDVAREEVVTYRAVLVGASGRRTRPRSAPTRPSTSTGHRARHGPSGPGSRPHGPS